MTMEGALICWVIFLVTMTMLFFDSLDKTSNKYLDDCERKMDLDAERGKDKLETTKYKET